MKTTKPLKTKTNLWVDSWKKATSPLSQLNPDQDQLQACPSQSPSKSRYHLLKPMMPPLRNPFYSSHGIHFGKHEKQHIKHFEGKHGTTPYSPNNPPTNLPCGMPHHMTPRAPHQQLKAMSKPPMCHIASCYNLLPRSCFLLQLCNQRSWI